MKTLARPRDRAEIVERLRAVRPRSERRWGSLSAHEMVCHVGDAYRMALARTAVRDASTLVDRTLVKWIALYSPLAWPEGLKTRPEIDQRHGAGTPPGDFDSDVADAVSLLEELVGDDEGLHGRRHPVFGAMSRAAWLRWGYLHADHHLRQFGV